jgi:hypothetical protein
VGQSVPVRSFTAEEEGQAADTKVWLVVREDKGNLARRIQFMCSQTGADAGITAADDEEVHAGILSGADCSFVIRGHAGGKITSPQPEGHIHETDERRDFY